MRTPADPFRRLGLPILVLALWPACTSSDPEPRRRIGAGGSAGDNGGASQTGGAGPSAGGGQVGGGAGGVSSGGAGGDASDGSASGGRAAQDASAQDGQVKDANASDGKRPLSDGSFVDRGPNPPDVLVRLINKCPFSLWAHSEGSGGAVLAPDRAEIKPGQTQDYHAPFQWMAARVSVWKTAGMTGDPVDKVEMTFDGPAYPKNRLNTNITYVDWVGLPSEVRGYGPGSDCTSVGCYKPVSEINSTCPAELRDGDRCVSLFKYCEAKDKNDQTDLCRALVPQAEKCKQLHADCTPDPADMKGYLILGCFANTFWGRSPIYCAAVNRGIVDTPSPSTPSSSFYVKPPYNVYSKWVHDVCPGIYAFPYDDVGVDNESGFHICEGGSQLDITWCPNG